MFIEDDFDAILKPNQNEESSNLSTIGEQFRLATSNSPMGEAPPKNGSSPAKRSYGSFTAEGHSWPPVIEEDSRVGAADHNIGPHTTIGKLYTPLGPIQTRHVHNVWPNSKCVLH